MADHDCEFKRLVQDAAEMLRELEDERDAWVDQARAYGMAGVAAENADLRARLAAVEAERDLAQNIVGGMAAQSLARTRDQEIQDLIDGRAEFQYAASQADERARQMEAMYGVALREVVELKARLEAVLALCADLCVCDFERENDYTECDACKIRAAGRRR